MRTTATTWNSAAKYRFGELLFFLMHNTPGHSVEENVQVNSSIWWLPQRVASSSKQCHKVEASLGMVDLEVWKDDCGMTADIRVTDVPCSS